MYEDALQGARGHRIQISNAVGNYGGTDTATAPKSSHVAFVLPWSLGGTGPHSSLDNH